MIGHLSALDNYYSSNTMHRSLSMFVIILDELFAHLQIQSTQVVLESHFLLLLVSLSLSSSSIVSLSVVFVMLLLPNPFINSTQILYNYETNLLCSQCINWKLSMTPWKKLCNIFAKR